MEYADFLEYIIRIENTFNDDVIKSIKGASLVYVLWDGAYDYKCFTNTTVSDLLYVSGEKLNITWITDMKQNSSNRYMLTLGRLSKANPKTFRGILKFTPKNTLRFDCFCVGRKENYSLDFSAKQLFTAPITQNESNVKANKDDLGDSFNWLNEDKRFCIETTPFRYGEAKNDLSIMLQTVIGLYYDIRNAWGVVYKWKGIYFCFPMDRECFKSLFKDREKVNGRKRVLPTVVRKHQRRNSDVTSHLRAPDYSCVIDGREFGFLIGAEDFGQIFPNTEYGHKKVIQIMKEAMV